MFQSEFEKSFISCCVLVEFTSSLHFLQCEKAYSNDFSERGRVLASGKFIKVTGDSFIIHKLEYY